MKFWIKNKINIATLSAVFFAVCIPFAKILTSYIGYAMLGGFLYFGAGIGLSIIGLFSKKSANKLTTQELPVMVAIVLLDISAITLLMFGISKTTGANASLLGNFELVCTSLFAYIIFKEAVSKRLMPAIMLITAACCILTFEGIESLVFNRGSLFVLLSALCWGLENNFTRKVSSKNTAQITTIKGLCSGMGSLILAIILKENFPAVKYIVFALLLGFISYGISVCLYIYAQRFLGAVKTGAYYSLSPFIGVIFCLIFLRELPNIQFYIALIFMIIGTILVIKDTQNS